MKKIALIFTEILDNLEELVDFLYKEGWEIVSSGPTAEIIKALNIPVKIDKSISSNVKQDDNFIELLYKIINAGQTYYDKNKNNEYFSLVCVNIKPKHNELSNFLYFDSSDNCIDLKRISIIRAAAKNYKDVITLTDPSDYKEAINQIRVNNVTTDYKLYLAGKALNLTAAYDAATATSILMNGYNICYPNYYLLPYKLKSELPHGINKQQSAALYTLENYHGALNGFKKIHGPEMTFNTYINIHTAWQEVTFFSKMIKNPFSVESYTHEGAKFTTQFTPAAGSVFIVGIKNATPIGSALGKCVLESFQKTYNCDPETFENAVLGCSSVIDESAALEMIKPNIRAIIAPDFTKEAKEIFAQKKELRLIIASNPTSEEYKFISLDGGMLIQHADNKLFNKWHVVTNTRPTQDEIDSMAFGMMVTLTTKSYSAIIVKNKISIGICTGQTSMYRAIKNAYEDSFYALKNPITQNEEYAEVLVCDSTIIFDDRIKSLIDNKIKAIIQTGGAPSDEAFINYCNEKNISMIFTGMQHLSF